MKKKELIIAITTEHETFESLLASLNEDQMNRKGVYGVLCVKDVVAHVAAWEAMEAEWLETSLRGETPVRYAPGFELDQSGSTQILDKMNAHIYEQNKDLPLFDVLAEYRDAHKRIFALVESFSEEELNDPDHFDWWKGEPIWTSIASNTYMHVSEHRLLIEKWLRRQGLRKF